MDFNDSKAIRKPVYEGNIGGKIHMLFVMNSQFVPISQKINVRDSTPLVPRVQGFSSPKLIGFSILNAQENPF